MILAALQANVLGWYVPGALPPGYCAGSPSLLVLAKFSKKKQPEFELFLIGTTQNKGLILNFFHFF